MQTRFKSLDALRGVAALLVVYDHMFANYAAQDPMFASYGVNVSGSGFPPSELVRKYVLSPLGIIQDGGWLGVCVFFLISGFVITKSSIEEPLLSFVVRRFFRVYPPLAAAIAVVFLLDVSAGHQRPISDYLVGATLVGYVIYPQIIVLGVAWTLAIEVLFYMLMAAISPLLKKGKIYSAFTVMQLSILLTLRSSGSFGDSFFLFAASIGYLPVLIMGFCLYVWRTFQINPIPLLIVTYANLFYAISSIHTAFLPIGNSYLVSIAYALAIFFVVLETSLPSALAKIGQISYSIYLLHGTAGLAFTKFCLTQGLAGLSPYIAIIQTMLASTIFYWGIERPSIFAGKYVSLRVQNFSPR